MWSKVTEFQLDGKNRLRKPIIQCAKGRFEILGSHTEISIWNIAYLSCLNVTLHNVEEFQKLVVCWIERKCTFHKFWRPFINTYLKIYNLSMYLCMYLCMYHLSIYHLLSINQSISHISIVKVEKVRGSLYSIDYSPEMAASSHPCKQVAESISISFCFHPILAQTKQLHFCKQV